MTAETAQPNWNAEPAPPSSNGTVAPADLNRLYHFTCAVEAGTITAAAQQVFLTQQALSISTRQLEQDLGVTLFDRTGRGLVTTPAGASLYTGATAILAATDNIVRRLRVTAAGKRPEFVIGYTPDLSAADAFTLADAVVDEDPLQPISAQPLSTNAIRAQLRSGEIDLGLCLGGYPYPDIIGAMVGVRTLRLAIRAEHELANRPVIELADLRNVPIVVSEPEQTSSITDYVVSHCRRSGWEPRLIVSPLRGAPPAVALRRHPQACTFVTDAVDQSGPDDGVVVRSVADPPVIPIQVSWLPHTSSPIRDLILARNELFAE